MLSFGVSTTGFLVFLLGGIGDGCPRGMHKNIVSEVFVIGGAVRAEVDCSYIFGLLVATYALYNLVFSLFPCYRICYTGRESRSNKGYRRSKRRKNG